jgi:hypothetical protein
MKTDLHAFLAMAAHFVRKDGWLSRTKADTEGGVPTAHKIHDALVWGAEVSMNDAEAGREAMEWLLTTESQTAHQEKLKAIAERGEVAIEEVGIMASVIPAYNAAKDHDSRQRAASRRSVCRGHYGTVGTRERGIKATCTQVRRIDSNYAYADYTTIVAFEVDGKDLTWFATGDKVADWVEGTIYKIDATIKDHKDDNWGQTTTINRVRRAK